MLLLKQGITRKRRVNEKTLPELEKKFEARNNKKYEVKTIINSAVYSKKVNNQMLGLHYFVS